MGLIALARRLWAGFQARLCRGLCTSIRTAFRVSIVVGLLTGVAACTDGGNWYLQDERHSQETAPDAQVTEIATIFVTRDRLSGRLYQDLGLLRVRIGRLATSSVQATRKDLDQELRKAAAKLGANAVVNVHYDTRTLPELRGLTGDATGTAVKFMD